MQTMLSEMGVVLDIVHLYTDSSAAKSFLSQRGLRKMRRIEVKELWLQAAVKEAKVKLHKIAGESNPSDLLTEYTDHHVVRFTCGECATAAQKAIKVLQLATVVESASLEPVNTEASRGERVQGCVPDQWRSLHFRALAPKIVERHFTVRENIAHV